jgi:hypothetical protein
MPINHSSTHNSAPVAAGEAYHRVNVDKLQFLLDICNRRPFAKPFLLLDESGGHFITSTSGIPHSPHIMRSS